MEYFNLTAKQAADLLAKALSSLEHGAVSQKRVQAEIGYPYLTKAKNFEKYRGKDPQFCYGWDRRALLQKVVETYQLEFDPEIASFIYHPEEQKTRTKTVWYVMHRWCPMLMRMRYSILSFSGSNSVRVETEEEDSLQEEVIWSGSYLHKGLYLFLDLVDETTRQLKALQSYFTGAYGKWRRYYLGTFSGVTESGSSQSGKLLLQQVTSKKEAQQLIKNPKQFSPWCEEVVRKGSTSITPSQAADPAGWSWYSEARFLVGEYTLAFMRDQEIHSGDLVLEVGEKARLLITPKECYVGSYQLYDTNLLAIELFLQDEQNKSVGSPLIIHCKVQRVLDELKVFSGILLGRNITLIPEALPLVVVASTIATHRGDRKEMLELLLDGAGTTTSRDYVAMRESYLRMEQE
ncbi:MAG: hypothetical protein AAFY71_19815 [Bacteroidota bacterium]